MAYDAFVVVTGEPRVVGETTDKTFGPKKAFEIHSFSLGANNQSTIGSASTGSGAGKVALSSFNVMKKTDSASPSLFKACCIGSHFDKVEVFLRKAGGAAGQECYLTYTFEQVLVDNVHWSGSSGGDDSPSEAVSFSYGKITIDYKPQKEKGTLGSSVMANWDARHNISV